MKERKKEERGSFKKSLKKFWWLLWKDDSFKGWAFSVIFLFLFVKFLFFPFLSLVTGTSLPLAIVESCSMYHKGGMFSNLNVWWDSHEDKYEAFSITKSNFLDFPLKKGFNKGDILFIIGADPKKLKEGDVIIFDANQRNPIIHRIVDIQERDGKRYFSTIGDNNWEQIGFEKEISENQLRGKAIFRLAPYLGWIKLVFYDWQKPASERGFCIEN